MDKRMKDLSIYVHIPFCVRKCNYCDFVSKSAPEEYMDKYVEALLTEIDNVEDKYRIDSNMYNICTIYIGGGTPSILNGNHIEEILNRIYNRFNIDNSLPGNMEITLEANPGTVDREKIKSYVDTGINRMSLGLQSSIDNELRMLGRIHSYSEFLSAYDCVRNGGIENVNIDIMTAIPLQTVSSLLTTLNRVVSLKPEHISTYSLILEEGTKLSSMCEQGEVILPGEELEREMYYETVNFLKTFGYDRYEISNFSKPMYESRHNCGYWTGREYIGFGASASSCINDTRLKNTSNISDYIENTSAPYVFEENLRLNSTDKEEEFMFLGLRMMKGIDKKEFNYRFKKDFDDVYGSVADRLIKEELLKINGETISLTDKGIDYGNYVFSKFLH